MNETIEDRVDAIKKCIDGLDDPGTEMVTMAVDNSELKFLGFFC